MNDAPSIRAQLHRLLAVVGLPLVGLVAVWAWYDARDHYRQASQGSLRLAETTAAETQRFVSDLRQILEMVARRPLVRAMDPSRCDPDLADFVALNARFGNLLVVDREGWVLCAARSPPHAPGERVRVADLELNERVHATRTLQVSAPFRGLLTDRWSVTFVVPVLDEAGASTGAVGLGVDLVSWQPLTRVADLPDGTVIQIVDAQGVVATRWPSPEEYVGRPAPELSVVETALQWREGALTAAGVDGVERVWGFVPVARSNWLVVAGVPAEPVLGAARWQILFALTAAAFVVLAAVTGGLLAARRISEPVSAIAAAAAAFAAGRRDARAPLRGPREVVEVAAELNRLVEVLARNEEELRTANTELERRVSERTSELAVANQELEAFAYSVSHDLRGPLRAIDGFSRLLEEEVGAGLSNEARTSLGRVRAGVRRMSELIDDLLWLSRVQRAELHRQPVDLSALAVTVRAELERGDAGRDVTWNIADELRADADPGLARVVLENLLGNAWKFTGGTAAARIEVGLGEHDGRSAFFVRDNGAGFDPAHAHNLFEPFQRLHLQSEFPGHGIGLATVWRILRRHGGDVWAEGEPGRGATFWFTFS